MWIFNETFSKEKEFVRTTSMNVRMHVGGRRHDAQHSDDDDYSEPEGNFDQRTAYEPFDGMRA
jgi:hypothetical protein